jgi:aerobic-type carbon monoxide dehydrogenase small subunit (CoxS/CutS family)
METEFRLTVNGAERGVTCEPDTPLLDVLRHDLGLAGPRFGCGMGLCGACFVLIGGRARASCDLPGSAVDGLVTTVEGPGPDHLGGLGQLPDPPVHRGPRGHGAGHGRAWRA